jgi:hypothetical protein
MTTELATTELTSQQKAEICGILSIGCDREAAADYIGCSLADVQKAMRNDPAFLTKVRRVEANAEVTHMRAIVEFAREKKDWKASVWWLERRSPERYGRRSAGAITERQLKEFIAIVADIMRDVRGTDDRQRVIGKLQSLADAIHNTLRDTSFDVASLFGDGEAPISDDAVDAADDLPSGDSNEWFGDLG